MAYIALKPCKFAGQRFKIGESVPAELLQPGAAKNLVKMGIIAESKDGEAVESTIEVREAEITVSIHTGDGDIHLEPTPAGLQAVFDALTSNVSGAETIINEITDGDALILLNAADNRKSIKELTEARAKALSATQEATV